MTVANLKPLTIGQLLDRAIGLYRRHFFLFVGIIALVQIPAVILTIVISLLQTGGNVMSRDVVGFAPVYAYLPTILVGTVVMQIGTAVLTGSVADHYLGKEMKTIIGAYSAVGRSWVSLLGGTLLIGMLVICLSIFFAIPCIGWASAIPGLGIILFFVMVVAPLLAPVIVLERASATHSIGRAWDLARRRFWPTLGLIILLNLLMQLGVLGPTMLVSALSVTTLAQYPVLSTIAQQLVSSLFTTLFLPIQLICITLLYFDIRVRTEGLDLTLAMAETTAVDPLTLMAAPAGAITDMRPSPTELGYFSLMTLAFVLFVGALAGILILIGVLLTSTMGGL